MTLASSALPNLPDYQVELLVRMYRADKLDSSSLHDFKALLPDGNNVEAVFHDRRE